MSKFHFPTKTPKIVFKRAKFLLEKFFIWLKEKAAIEI